MIKKYTEFIKESLYLTRDFNITYNELSDILSYINEEFPQINYSLESSVQSSLIEDDDNCFIIVLDDGSEIMEAEGLYFLEPKIWEIIADITSQLKPYGLYVCTNDYGESDIYYELVVCKIGHKFTEKQHNW